MEDIKEKIQQQEENLKVQNQYPHSLASQYLIVLLQERTENVDQRRAAIDKANRDYAELKLRRDDLANQQK